MYRGIHRGQRHEAKVGRVSDHLQVGAGIDTGKVQARWCSCREVCVVGAGDNTKMVPVAGKANVGQASVPRCYAAQ